MTCLFILNDPTYGTERAAHFVEVASPARKQRTGSRSGELGFKACRL